MTKEELLNMNLHEKKELSSSMTILRVYGGWIYYEYCPTDFAQGSDTAVFVPEEINVEAHTTDVTDKNTSILTGLGRRKG